MARTRCGIHCPSNVQKQLIDKKMKFFVIDAVSLAEEIGLGARINMIMQTAFFVISGIIPKEEAIKAIKKEITKTYGKKGEEVLQMNYAAVDTALQNIAEVAIPGTATSKHGHEARGARECPRFRAERDGDDDRRQGRLPARVGHPR